MPAGFARNASKCILLIIIAAEGARRAGNSSPSMVEMKDYDRPSAEGEDSATFHSTKILQSLRKGKRGFVEPQVSAYPHYCWTAKSLHRPAVSYTQIKATPG